MDYSELIARQERYHERWFSGAPMSRVPQSEKLPPHVTVKQRQILTALTVLRFASVKYLMDFTGRKERRVQETMAELRDKQLVGWFRWIDTRNVDDGLDPLTTTPVYCLTTRGLERCILDRVIQDDRFQLTRTWKGKPVLPSTMPHQIGIVEIMLSLTIASRHSETHEFRDMIPDFVFEELEEKSRVATIENLNTPHEVRADLIARIWAKILETSFTAYIELERKSKAAPKIQEKLDNYSVLFKSKNRRFDFGLPVLLYIVTDCEHERDTTNRVELVRQWASTRPIAPAFRISTLRQVKYNPLGMIWKKADGSSWGIGGE